MHRLDPRPRPRSRGAGVRALTLAAVALLGGCTSEETSEVTPRPVVWAEARSASLTPARRVSGVVQRSREAPLAFDLPGRVDWISVDVGDAFAEGELLAQLEQRPYRLELSRRESELDSARSEVRVAEEDFLRLERLAGEGAVSEAELDDARARRSSARSREQALEAALALAREDLEDTALVAPYAGTVVERLAEPAQQIRPATPVLSIQGSEGRFEVSTSVPETLVHQIARGQRHEVIVAALAGDAFSAVVREIGSDVSAPGAYPVVLGVTAAIPGLRAGMTAEVRLATSSDARADAVSVPATAYVASGDGSRGHVFLIDASGSAVSRQAVTLDRFRGDRALISAGLSPGQRVVSKGAAFLRDGQTVSLLDAGTRRYAR